MQLNEIMNKLPADVRRELEALFDASPVPENASATEMWKFVDTLVLPLTAKAGPDTKLLLDQVPDAVVKVLCV